MVIEVELAKALSSLSRVRSLVGNRIWDEWFRSNETPAVVFEIDAERRENSLDGRGGLVFADVNVICRADTRAKSRELAEAVRVNGTDPGTGMAGYSDTFDAVLDDMQPSAVPKNDGSDKHWYDTNMSFTLSWSEAE